MIRSTANDLLTFLAANMGLTETELQPALQLANTTQLVRQIISRLPFTLVQDSPKDLAPYAGRYQLSDGNIVTIHVDGTRIFIQLPDEPEYELCSSSENQFFMPVSDLEIMFYRNDRGEVDRAVGMVEGVT